MYQCKTCGGNLKFSIEEQMLKCDYCGNLENPDSFSPDKDADEKRIRSGEYEVTVYTCSQCGAEIMGDETTIATFCNFCGGTAILHGRISHEKCPDKIIPFMKTKEDCKKAYKKLTRFALFAPSAMKKEENIERFRGIYMPFWLYDIKKKGDFQYEGVHTLRSGDYIDNCRYEMHSNVDISFEDICYDASSSFADNLSDAITPYDMKEARDFTPSYLSGFYADTSDVDASVYQAEALDLIGDEIYTRLQNRSKSSNYHLNRQSIIDSLKAENPKGRLALMPVWFLSYRNKNKICYAAINGQTGQAAADLPIDFGKYLLGSLLLALPVFLLLNFIFSFHITSIVVLAMIFSTLCAFFSYRLKKELKMRKNHSDDLGMIYRMEKNKKTLEIPRDEEFEKLKETVENRKAEKKYNHYVVLGSVIGFGGGILILVASVITAIFFDVSWLMSKVGFYAAVFLIAAALGWIRAWIEWGRKKKNAKVLKLKFDMEKKKQKEEELSVLELSPIILMAALGIVPGLLVLILQPASDLYYYGSAVWVILLNLLSMLFAANAYNKLTMRKLPQFNVRGGEENE